MNSLSLARKISKLIKYPFDLIAYKRFGFKSLVYKPIMIYGRKYMSFGKSVVFFTGARIEAISSYASHTYHPNLVIGDRTSFEQDAHIICGSNMIIGHDCVFSSRVFITNCNHDLSNPTKNKLETNLFVKDVKIGNYCFFGMDVKIFPGVTIGDNVVAGANTLINHDVPSDCMVVGCPARIIKRFNRESNSWEKV